MVTLPDPVSLLVMMLVTERCPLHCGYCEMRRSGEDMPVELALQVMEELDRRLPEGRPILFVWHGGEPLLRGVEFFRRIHDLQAPLRSRRPIQNMLQTNGLLLDEAWFDFIQATGDFRPNLSMDGPVSSATRGVAAEAYDGIFAALRVRAIEFGIAVVGSPELLAHKDEALRWFEQKGLSVVGMTPYQVCGAAPGSLPSPQLLADLSLDAQGRGTLLGSVILEGMREQHLCGTCRLSSFLDGCHRHVLCVDPRGDLFTCLRGKWSGLWTWGNVHTGGLETWQAAQAGPPPFRPTLPEACEPCAWKDRCGGGCPSNAKAMNGGADQPDFYCESFQRMFAAQEIQVLEEALVQVEAARAMVPSPH